MKGEFSITIGTQASAYPLGVRMRPDPTLFQYRISSGVAKAWDESLVAASSKIQFILAMAQTRPAQTFYGQQVFVGYGSPTKTRERVIVFAFDGFSRAQLMRNATSWGINFEASVEKDACFDHLCLPRIHRTRRDHLQIIKTEISDFQPSRIAY